MCDTRPSTPCFLRPDSPTSSVSESFISLSGKHTEPRKYNQFATSFICTEPPVPNTFYLESSSDSESEEFSRIPFKNPIPIGDGQTDPRLAKKDKVATKSVRSRHLIPETGIVLNEILHPPKIESREARANYTYYRAKQWCEVNKALVVDQKYPKPDPEYVRKQHSAVHQEAIKLTREELEAVSGKSDSGASISPIVSEPHDSATSFADRLNEIFADIQPIPELTTREEPWQFKALKTAEVHSKTKSAKPTPRHFKRNIYPPKTRDQIIQERRTQLPPPKPDHLETDYLSGIWEPEIMLNEFKITGFGYDSRIIVEDSDKPVTNISWYDLQEIRTKCNEWLDRCKEFL